MTDTYTDDDFAPVESVDYHKKRDGILRIERPSGRARFLTLWETILYRFGVRR